MLKERAAPLRRGGLFGRVGRGWTDAGGARRTCDDGSDSRVKSSSRQSCDGGSSRTSARHERHTAAHRARARGGSMHNTCAARSCGRRSKCSARGSSSERRREGALSSPSAEPATSRCVVILRRRGETLRRPRRAGGSGGPDARRLSVKRRFIHSSPNRFETTCTPRAPDAAEEKRRARIISPVQNARRRRRGRFPAEMITFEKSKRALSNRTRPDRIHRRPRIRPTRHPDGESSARVVENTRARLASTRLVRTSALAPPAFARRPAPSRVPAPTPAPSRRSRAPPSSRATAASRNRHPPPRLPSTSRPSSPSS